MMLSPEDILPFLLLVVAELVEKTRQNDVATPLHESPIFSPSITRGEALHFPVKESGQTVAHVVLNPCKGSGDN